MTLLLSYIATAVIVAIITVGIIRGTERNHDRHYGYQYPQGRQGYGQYSPPPMYPSMQHRNNLSGHRRENNRNLGAVIAFLIFGAFILIILYHNNFIG